MYYCHKDFPLFKLLSSSFAFPSNVSSVFGLLAEGLNVCRCVLRSCSAHSTRYPGSTFLNKCRSIDVFSSLGRSTTIVTDSFSCRSNHTLIVPVCSGGSSDWLSLLSGSRSLLSGSRSLLSGSRSLLSGSRSLLSGSSAFCIQGWG